MNSKKPNPGISFVIPAHNEADYLPKTLIQLGVAIEGLRNQVPEFDCEIIVVNDGSTDDTGKIAAPLADRVIDVEMRNIGAVRNAGAEAARFQWLLFLDADTSVPTETLVQAYQEMRNGAVGGGAHVDVEREPPIPFVKLSMYRMVYVGWQLAGKWAAGCFMFCRKEAFDRFGGFDTDYFAAEEFFFSRNLKRQGRFVLVKPPVITSARKLHKYSVWQLSRFLFLPLLSGRNALKSTRGLELLYKDDR